MNTWQILSKNLPPSLFSFFNLISGSIDLPVNSDAVTRAELRRTRLDLIRREYEVHVHVITGCYYFWKTWSSVKEWIPTILHFNHYPWYNITPLLWLPRKKMLHWKVHPNNIIFRHRVIWIQSLFWIFRQRGWPRIHQCYVIFLAPVWPKWY